MAEPVFENSLYDQLEEATKRLTALRVEAEQRACDEDSTFYAARIANTLKVVGWLDRALTAIDIAVTDKLSASEFVQLWRRNGLDDRRMP